MKNNRYNETPSSKLYKHPRPGREQLIKISTGLVIFILLIIMGNIFSISQIPVASKLLTDFVCTSSGSGSSLGHFADFLLLDCCKFPSSSDLQLFGTAVCGKILCTKAGWSDIGIKSCIPVVSPPGGKIINEKKLPPPGQSEMPTGVPGKKSLNDNGNITENDAKNTKNESMILRPPILRQEPDSNNTHD